MSQLVKFDFSILPGEQLDTLIKIPDEKRGAIHGTVIDECHKPVENAVVKLFENEKRHDDKKKDKLIPITHEFTDKNGQFLFGPLCADKCYTIKIWVNDVCQNFEKFEGKVCQECIEPKLCCDGPKDHDPGQSTK